MDQLSKAILKCVCIEFSTTIQELHSRTRVTEISLPRSVTFWLMHYVAHKAYAQIGREYGRDHTSIISQVKRVQDLMQTDAEFRNRVQRVRMACEVELGQHPHMKPYLLKMHNEIAKRVEMLLETGLYGSTFEAVVERLLSERLQQVEVENRRANSGV